MFFIPSSPQWLLSKDCGDEAIAALRHLRPKENGENGNCSAEIEAIREALKEHVHKAPWRDLVRGNNLRRTMIVIIYYFFQQVFNSSSPKIISRRTSTLQTTGQAFVSTYQTQSYKTNGYADHAFTYPVISSCLGFLSVLPGMYFVDRLG